MIVIPEDRPKYETTLDDGAALTLSPILKTDRDFFARGLEELSIESRFARFGQGVARLSERELDYLTDVDQRRHVAWGAAVGPKVAGVGRYIRSGDGCAEFAITVLDRFQDRGVGRVLLAALVAVARSDGVEAMCFEANADNAAVQRLLGEIELGPTSSRGTLERRIRLSDLPEASFEDELVAVIDEVRRHKTV